MKSLSQAFQAVLLTGVITSVAPSVYAQKSITDIEREEIIIFSRQGDAQLNQAIPRLETLFDKTHDAKVRDDLIALYLKVNKSDKAPVSYTHLDVYKRQILGYHFGVLA